MEDIIFYEPSTGKIELVFSGSSEVANRVIQDNNHLAYITGKGNGELQYIENNLLTYRPVQNTTIDKTIINADGVDKITISGAPKGNINIFNPITKNNITSLIEDSEEFVTTIPGKYIIQITAFPFLDFLTTIEAI